MKLGLIPLTRIPLAPPTVLRKLVSPQPHHVDAPGQRFEYRKEWFIRTFQLFYV
jgi:hypothetical protein